MGHRNARRRRSSASSRRCFNPCCRGWVTATTIDPRIDSLDRAEFQSLLSWIGHRNMPLGDRRSPSANMFQSLLSWIGHRNWPRPGPRRTALRMFQSLLSWIGHRNLPDRRTSASCRFNPCCRGSVTATAGPTPPTSRRLVSILVVVDGSPQRQARSTGARLDRFQSLLSWIGHRNSITIASVRCRQLFQSLLSWIGHRNPSSRHRQSSGRCFNPCCRGSVTATASRLPRPRSIGVSILVVVDRSPQRRRPRPAAGRSVSILVVVDRSPQRGLPADPLTHVFQSLLSWMGHRNPSGPLKCDTSYG